MFYTTQSFNSFAYDAARRIEDTCNLRVRCKRNDEEPLGSHCELVAEMNSRADVLLVKRVVTCEQHESMCQNYGGAQAKPSRFLGSAQMSGSPQNDAKHGNDGESHSPTRRGAGLAVTVM